MKTKSKKNPECALQSIEKTIKISRRERQRMSNIIHKFVQGELVQEMRQESPVFNALYKNIYFAGSFYDGLRVKDAREFDLDLVLAYPKAGENISIEFDSDEPGFAKMHLVNELPVQLSRDQQVESLFRSHFAQDSYISRERTYSHLYSIVARVTENITPHQLACYGLRELVFRRGGPAVTLTLTTMANEEVDVDLVIAFVFRVEMIRENNRELYKNLKSLPQSSAAEQNKFFLVPKKPKTDHEPSDSAWRLSFPNQERLQMKKLGIGKPVIRLLKYFRDRNPPLTNLSSYALKTVVAHMRREEPRERPWLRKKRADLFLEALHCLHEFLMNKRIPDLFDSGSNLLWSMRSGEIENIAGFLQRKIEHLQGSRNTIECYDTWTAVFSASA